MRVRVVHGDLRYAKYPIMVGHYEGDTIAGAEAQLDRRLDHALSDRYQLGLYPGELGTVAVLQRESAEGERQTDLIILTHDTREGRMNQAMATMQALPTVLAPIV